MSVDSPVHLPMCMPEKEISVTCSCKNQQELCPRETKCCKRWRCCSKRPPQTPSMLQHKDSSLKNSRDIRGGSKLTNFRAMARMAGIGATLSRYGSSAKLHCSFVELTPTQPAWCKWALNLCTLLIWLTMLTPPKSQGWPGLLLVASPCKQLASACATDSQRSTNLTQAAASLSMHGSSCQVASNPAQTTTDFGLHKSPSQEAPDQPTCGQLPMTTSSNQLAP